MTDHDDWNPDRDWRPVMEARVPDASTVYDEVRARCPVPRTGESFGGFHALLDHEDVRAAALDTGTFSNVVQLFGVRRPPLESDPPEHKHYRRMLNKYFLPGRLRELEPRIRAHAADLLEPLVDAGGGDFIPGFAHPFPARVLCELLAIPTADWRLLLDWATRVDEIGGSRPPGDPARNAVGDELMPYMQDLIERRRREPGDDIISGMITGHIDGRALNDDEVLGLVMMLLSAGHNTTRSGVGNLVLRMAGDPALLKRLHDDRNLITRAVEESLRLDSPQQAMRRVATRDTEVRGYAIKQGEYVWLAFGAANLDPGAWDDPTEFDLDRDNKHHLAFGKGVHQCLGAPLARLEMQVAIEELLDRVCALTVDGEVARPPWPRMGVSALPVRMAPRKVSA